MPLITDLNPLSLEKKESVNFLKKTISRRTAFVLRALYERNHLNGFNVYVVQTIADVSINAAYQILKELEISSICKRTKKGEYLGFLLPEEYENLVKELEIKKQIEIGV